MPLLGKSRQTRQDETIDFIQEHVPPAESASVGAYVAGKFSGPGAYGPVDREGVLDAMSVGSAGKSDERAMRRAVIMMARLLEGGLGVTPDQVKAVGLPTLNRLWSMALYRTRLLADQESNAVGLLRRVFEQQLVANPDVFLRQHVLMINGTSLTAGLVNVRAFHFLYSPAYDRFEISPGGPPADKTGAHGFSPISVPAVDWKNVPGRGTNPAAGSFAQIDPTQLTGATVMVTTQFTGCAFCLKRSGGQLHAAHVSPSNMPLVGAVRGPTTLAQQLAGLDGAVTGGDFTGAGGVDPFRVYGAGYSNLPGLGTGYPLKQNPGDYMVIVGLLSGGSWAFHSQHVMEYRRIAAAVRFTYS